MSARSFVALADAVPNTIADWVLPPAVMVTVWHPLAPYANLASALVPS